MYREVFYSDLYPEAQTAAIQANESFTALRSFATAIVVLGDAAKPDLRNAGLFFAGLYKEDLKEADELLEEALTDYYKGLEAADDANYYFSQATHPAFDTIWDEALLKHDEALEDATNFFRRDGQLDHDQLTLSIFW